MLFTSLSVGSMYVCRLSPRACASVVGQKRERDQDEQQVIPFCWRCASVLMPVAVLYAGFFTAPRAVGDVLLVPHLPSIEGNKRPAAETTRSRWTDGLRGCLNMVGFGHWVLRSLLRTVGTAEHSGSLARRVVPMRACMHV